MPACRAPFPEKPPRRGSEVSLARGLLCFLWGKPRSGLHSGQCPASASFPREEILTSSRSSSTMAVGGGGKDKRWGS